MGSIPGLLLDEPLHFRLKIQNTTRASATNAAPTPTPIPVFAPVERPVATTVSNSILIAGARTVPVEIELTVTSLSLMRASYGVSSVVITHVQSRLRYPGIE